MADGKVYDHIVVGAGIMGCATAYELAKRNQSTLLLEQFALPHTRGSSHGKSRIIRHAYGQTHYAQMMPESYVRWQQLEREAGRKLYTECGLLNFTTSEDGPELLKKMETNLVKLNSKHTKMSREAMQLRFPGITFPLNSSGLYEEHAGALKADSALTAFQTVFVRCGGRIQDECRVLDIQPGQVITVNTSQGLYRAKNVVLTAGAYTAQLTSQLHLQLPLQPLRTIVAYFRAKNDNYKPENGFPTFIELTKEHIYGMPEMEYENLVKVALFGGSAIKPTDRDLNVSTFDIEAVRQFVSKFMPGLSSDASIVEPCMFTMTPDNDFIIDRHPKWNNIIIGAGFSGHGFKLSPVVGKLLCELSMRQSSSYDLTPFKISRFQNTTQSKL